MIGSQLAHYRITGELGAGGMGEVWRAEDTKLGRQVALKVLPAEHGEHPDRIERFEREARAVAALNHPNIVTIYSVEEADGVRFLTMELIEGRPLDRFISDRGMDLNRFLDLATPIAEALASAHEKGVIHRDLKPSNVMITEDGRVKVLDFGLAKLLETQDDPDPGELPTEALTGFGVVMGTMPYMSPEQVEGQVVDHRTDIFSLGILMYEMATGGRPFAGKSSPGLMSAILKDEPTPVLDRRRDLPNHLGRVIGRCLAKDRRERYQTARDVFNELRIVRRESGSLPGATEPPYSEIPQRSPSDTSSVSAATGSDVPWIAVLPFSSPVGDSDIESFAEGLEEDIATGLSRFSYLFVVSRKSTRCYRGEAIDVRLVGEKLGARYVMEGGIRRAGSRIRIGMNLIDASTGTHLWSETYDRDMDVADVFDLQDEITDRVVATVADPHGALTRSMALATEEKPPESLTSHEAVLRHFLYRQRISADDHLITRTALEHAAERDPHNAEVLAALAGMHIEEANHDFNAGPDPLGKALTIARRAVEADPSSQLAHFYLAQAYFHSQNLSSFKASANRALDLNRRSTDTMAMLGILFGYAGDGEKGVELVTRSMELNPHHPGWYRFSPFIHAYRLGHDAEALEIAEQINMPEYWGDPLARTVAHAQLGHRRAAEDAARDLLRVWPSFEADYKRVGLDPWVYAVPDLADRIVDGLKKAGLTIHGAAHDSDRASEKLSAEQRPETGSVSIAVLPFADMSPDKDQDFFCEGMAEEIMNSLVHVDGIQVASRTSTFKAVEEGRDLKAIGRALSVGRVLEGSVRLAGNRLRVTAQLTEVASGYQMWSERYDREAEDVFAIQDEIAAGVVDAVTSSLDSAVRKVPARKQVGNVEAYRHYLKGRHYRYSKNDHGNALRCFEAAVALDPTHAPSWVAIAESKMLGAVYTLLPPDQAIREARTALATAEVDLGGNAEALYVQGQIALAERNWEEAERVLRRAANVEPHHVRALCWLALVLATLRRKDEATLIFERAREADPLASYPYGMSACGLLVLGDPETALGFAEQAMTFERTSTLALWPMGVSLVALGRCEEGVAALAEAVEHGHRAPFMLGLYGWALAVSGRVDDARTILEELGTRPSDAPTVVAEAWLLAALGRQEDAWRALGRAAIEHQPIVSFSEYPGYDPFRVDPRFATFVERLGLPPSNRLPDESADPATQEGDAEPVPSRQSDAPTATHRAFGNLPAPVDTFVAREQELAEVSNALRGSRLVTLVGAGGTGKTRLALEAAGRLAAGFPDGAWLIELAPVAKGEAVPHVVADIVGAVQQPGKTIIESVVDVLGHRSLLLVLDNCEHVLDAAAELAEAISIRCPTVHILTTSRENLAIRGEQVIRLLSLPDEHGALLFRDRARAAGANSELDMDALARLSRRLDGMPLAIELAAARCASMSPEEIERGLDDRFRLLRGSRRGRIERHQTLHSTVAWSYDLLQPIERRVFDRLSVFAGDFDMQAATAVVGGDHLQPAGVEDAIATLVERSMVLASTTEEGTRFRLLETLRQYGAECLAATGDAESIRERHVRWYSAFMQRAWTGLWSSDDGSWVRAVGREYENLRVAVYAAIDTRDRKALTALLTPHIWWAWHALRYEVGDWAESALSVKPEPDAARSVAVHLRFHGGRPDDAVRLAQGLVDPANVTDPEEACLSAWAHFNASIITNDPDASRWMRRWIEAGHRTGNDARAATIASIEVAFRMMAGDTEEARRIAAESHEKARSTGNQTALCWTNFFMGRALSDSDPHEALQHFERATEIAERIRIPLVGGIASTEAATVIARTEEPDQAWPRLARALRSFIDSGDRRQLWTSAHHLAYLLVGTGREDDARRLWDELGNRQAYAARHHRDELEDLLGRPGKSILTDDELVEHIRDMVSPPAGETV